MSTEIKRTSDGQWAIAPVRYRFDVFNNEGDQVGLIIAQMDVKYIIRALKKMGLINPKHWNSSYSMQANIILKLGQPYLRLEYAKEITDGVQ